MQALFRRRCDDLVSSYVRASLARGAEVSALHATLDHGACRVRKRLSSLEQELSVTNRLVEDLMWEVEWLNFRVQSLERCDPCEPANSSLKPEPDAPRKHGDDLEWTRI
jgi:hypothetical protein